MSDPSEMDNDVTGTSIRYLVQSDGVVITMTNPGEGTQNILRNSAKIKTAKSKLKLREDKIFAKILSSIRQPKFKDKRKRGHR